jgi:hypothetical protein
MTLTILYKVYTFYNTTITIAISITLLNVFTNKCFLLTLLIQQQQQLQM